MSDAGCALRSSCAAGDSDEYWTEQNKILIEPSLALGYRVTNITILYIL